MKSRILVTFLMLCLLSQLGGIWMVYTTAIAIHKQNKHRRLSDRSKWTTHVFTLPEFNSSLNGQDELILEGNLFDIVSITRGEEYVAVILVEDKAENKLKNTLSGIQQGTSGWSETAQKAVTLGTAIYLVPEKTVSTELNWFILGIRHAAYRSLHQSNEDCRSIDHPPSLKTVT